MNTVLFIMSGLPATGKSTLSKLISNEYNAVYLRIDTIEQGLRDLCHINVQGEGYRLAYRVAADNLTLGHNVLADLCNPIALTRNEWQDVAMMNNSLFVNIEVQCSDEAEHLKRVENRINEVSGLKLPTWHDIEQCAYDTWQGPRIIIDTAGKSVAGAFNELNNKVRKHLKLLQVQ